MLISASLLLLIFNTLDHTQGFINEVQAKKLVASKITQDDFTITWQRISFNNAESYTVELNNPIPGCEETTFDVSCKDPGCSFTLSEHSCSTQPCTNVDITVNADGTASNSQFNTAPVVTELDTSIACEVNGTIATVSWSSENVTNGNSNCATQAEVKIKIGGVTSGVLQIIDTKEDGEVNYAKVELDPCDTGTVDAYVTYVTGDKNYETNAKGHESADTQFPGVGIMEPPETILADISCSIHASWDSDCDKIDDYLLTWVNGGGIKDETTLGDTSYTIPDLKPGNYNVCVSAFYIDTLIGEELCIEDVYVKQDCVNPTTTVITTTTIITTTVPGPGLSDGEIAGIVIGFLSAMSFIAAVIFWIFDHLGNGVAQ